MTCPTLARVKYYNEIEEQDQYTTVLLNARSFTDAMKQIEDYFGDDLEKADIQLFAEGLIEFPAAMADVLEPYMKEYV